MRAPRPRPRTSRWLHRLTVTWRAEGWTAARDGVRETWLRSLWVWRRSCNGGSVGGRSITSGQYSAAHSHHNRSPAQTRRVAAAGT